MIDYKVMEAKIKLKEAKVIRVNERAAKSGKYTKIVELYGVTYKLCVEQDCLFYKTLDNFTFNKSAQNHFNICKNCRNKQHKSSYKSNLNAHIRQRWYSINSKVKNPKDMCTREEFEEFFMTARCAYTGRTLVEEFENPSPNKNLRLEIDHIIPVTVGGSSKPFNLQVIPKVINQIKTNCTQEQFRETLNFLAQFGVKVR